MDKARDLASIEREGRLRVFAALALVGICLAALAYVGWRALGGGGGIAAVGGQVSDVRLQDAQGRSSRLADYRGRVVVVDVWATWCPPCRASLPEIAKLQRAGDARFAVVAISVDDGGFDAVLPFLARNPGLGLTAHVPQGPGALAPLGDIPGIPTTFILDREGKVAVQWSGYYPGRVEAELRRVLGS